MVARTAAVVRATMTPTMTLWEYLRKEVTDVRNVLLVALIALAMWAALWFSLIERAIEWYHIYIACVEDARPSKTLGDVIRSRRGCV
jgi:hypothetical protein